MENLESAPLTTPEALSGILLFACMFLPAVDAPLTVEPMSQPSIVPPRGHETILSRSASASAGPDRAADEFAQRASRRSITVRSWERMIGPQGSRARGHGGTRTFAC